MATLIAANYQSTTITSYGGISMSCGTLKANTLYTLKCRYKYTKNTSSFPQILCYNSNWSYGGSIYDASDDGVMKTRVITFTSYPSAVNYNIDCYAWSYDNQNNGVGGKTGVLEVDWYELWEGDATTFSLTDAIALSENKNATNFVSIGGHPTDVGTCTNTGYFSTAEPRHALRSWMGYYYKTHSTTSYGDWAYTYNHYTSASRSRTVTTYDHYSNGKVVQVSRITQTEDATVTYANWSYNWVTTGNSSRSRTVTYTWSDYAPQFTQTETNGGTRYLVLSEETYDGAGGKIVYSFPANGAGSKSLTVYAHDYWGSTCISTSTKISDVSVTCTGFTPTVSGSTITITASNLGTTPTNYKRSTITISKSGFQTRSGYTSVEQEANAITSYGTPQMKGIKWSSFVPAGGGSSTPSITSYSQTAAWTSGSKSNITSGASISFTRAQIVRDIDPEFYNGPNNMNIYDNAGSGKTTLTRVTSGYPSGIPNNSGVAYRIQNTGAGPSPNLGGFYHNYGGTSGQTYIWTFDAYVPTGYELQHNHNSLGSGGSYTWRTPTVGANEWRTYSVEVYFGTSNSTAFFCSLVGTAGSSSAPVTWWIANSKICKISGITLGNSSAPTINTTTGAVTLASRGTTTGNAGVVDTNAAVLGTITMNGKTGKFVAAPSQEANAITSYENPTFDMWWSTGTGNSSTPVGAGGGTSAAPTYTVSQKANYTSGSQGSVTPNVTSAVFSDANSSSTTIKSTYSIDASTGKVTFGSLGTTTSSNSTVLYVKLTVVSHGKTGTDNGGCWQAANTKTFHSVFLHPYKPDSSWIIDVNNNGTTDITDDYWATCPASGGYVKLNGYKHYTYTSGSSSNELITTDAAVTWSTGKDSWITNHVNGGYYINSRGTTIGNSRSSTATWTYDGKTSAGKTITQSGNYVTSISASGATLSYSNIGPAATSASATTADGVTYTFSSGSTSTTAPSSTYGSLSTANSYSIANTTTNGFTAINSSTGALTATSRGTTIGNARKSATVTRTVTYTWTPTSSYNAAGTKTATAKPTATCTQNGNYVTKIEANSNSFSYGNIGAGATSAAATTSHAPKYTFSTGKTSTTTPGSDYGSLSTSVTYTIANTTTNGFTAINSSTGALTATSRGTTIGNARTSATVTKTLKYTWTHTSTYGSSSVNTGNLTKTATCTQDGNYITSITAKASNTSYNHFYYANTAAAGGTTSVSTNGTATYVFSSGSTGTYSNSTTPTGVTWTFARTYKTTGTNATLNTSTGAVTWGNNTTANTRSINVESTLTVTCKHSSDYSAGGTKTSTITHTSTSTQNAGVRTYQIVLNPSSITWAASGGSQSVTVQYNTLWNGIKTAGPTTLTGYTVSPSNCTASGTSGTTTLTVGQNTSSSSKTASATFSKSGYSSATLTGTQNKPVTATVYRIAEVSPSTKSLGNAAGTDYVTIKMDKGTQYKNTTSSSAFKTDWVKVTGKEAQASSLGGIIYVYFQRTTDTASVGWIRSGSPVMTLTNGTSTSAAVWNANVSYDANTDSTSRQAKILVCATEYDLQGAGKNYCTVTQAAGSARIPIQIWGRNENRTDIYVTFSQMKVYVYQSSNTSETHVENVAFGGGISAGYITERRQLTNLTWYVDRLTYPTITQVTVDFSDVTIENTLDPSRYRNCEVWAEVCEGDISMEGYGVSGRYKSNNTVTLNTNQYSSWYGQSHTFTFGGFYNGSYSTGAPLNDNSVVVLFFRFYDY